MTQAALSTADLIPRQRRLELLLRAVSLWQVRRVGARNVSVPPVEAVSGRRA